MYDYPTFGKIIKAVNFTVSNFDTIILYFEHKTITLYAYGDCCSVSNFEILNDDLTPLLGKKMLSITTVPSYIDKGKSNELSSYDDYKSVKVTPITIHFDDNTTFDFELHNTSNGYYDGWMEVKEGEPIILPNFH